MLGVKLFFMLVVIFKRSFNIRDGQVRKLSLHFSNGKAFDRNFFCDVNYLVASASNHWFAVLV